MKPTISFLLTIIVAIVLFISGCRSPYELMPNYEAHINRMKSIAIYPLHYSKHGNEEMLFGTIFFERFVNDINYLSLIKPINFISPDSTILLFKDKNINFPDTRGGAITPSVVPKSRAISSRDLSTISKEVDGVIFCDLKSYNEVSVGEEMGQAIATTCLTGGLISYSEVNQVQMEIILYDTKTGISIWKYTPNFSASLSGEQRKEFTHKIINGFKDYFPLLTHFKKK